MVEGKDIFTIVVSSLSLIISMASLYLSNFRRPKTSAEIGPFIHIYYHPPDQTGFYLPVVFHNNSPTKAIVYKAFLEIIDTNGRHFALRWLTSNSIDKEMNYTETGAAAPFKMDGYEAKSDVLQFAWHNHPDLENLEFVEGSYEVTLYVWTANRTKPNISITERFDISKELAEIMHEKRSTGDNTTRYFPLA